MKKGRMMKLVLFLMLSLACGNTQEKVVTSESQKRKAPIGKADKILVEKSKRKLYLLRRDTIIATYSISLGEHPKGHKTQEGDEKTPEGKYTIDYRNSKSSYHLSLHISYPNQVDKDQAAKRGVSPGGDIMIHGLPKKWAKLGKGHLLHNWTDGCIAVTNEEIDEIWKAVDNGIVIEIRP